MEHNVYISNLFDIYSSLFTEKQTSYFIDYYFNNLTLSEMSENYKVSRNAVFKNIKDTENKLIYYENNLKIYEKKEKLKKLLNNYEKNKEEILEILE